MGKEAGKKIIEEEVITLSAFYAKKLGQYNEDFYGEYFLKRQQLLFSELVSFQTITDEDKKLYEKFCKHIKERRAKSEDNKIHFSYEDIDALGIEADVKIIYGGKNIGKTYATSQLVTEKLRNPKEKVMLLRNTRLELNTGFKTQLDEPNWPVRYIISGSKLVRKKGYLPERGPETKARKGRPKRESLEDHIDADNWKEENDRNHCGWATCLTGIGLRAFQGAGYVGLSTLIWDECNDVGDITEQDIKAFLIFVLSLERDKKKFDIYMIGNLLRQESGMAANLFLDSFGIPYDAKLKYWTTENGLKILYINTGEAGELYDGVKSQKYTELFGQEAAEDLRSNQPLAYSEKVLSRSFFLKMCKPLFSFVVMCEKQFWIVYLGSYEDRKLRSMSFICKLEKFNKSYHHPGYYPVTDDINAVNQFGNLKLVKKSTVGRGIKKIFMVLKRRLMFYADDQSRVMLTTLIMPKLESRYKEWCGAI